MNFWISVTAICQHLWELYVCERSPGWQSLLKHVVIYCVVGFIFTLVFLLGLYWFLPSVALFTTLWIATSILLCWSKHARCFSVLFLLSCGLHEGRNALITAGTGIVICRHMENIFHNLEGLMDGITCNLRAQGISIHMPLLQKYIEALYWIYDQGTSLCNPFGDIVSLNHTLAVSVFSSSEAFEAKLNDTREEVLNMVDHISTTVETASSLVQGLLAIAGLAFVLLGTGLFMRRFLGSRTGKFKNIYITKNFIQFDEQERLQRRPCVLPLSRKERKKYVVIPSFCPTPRERRSLGLFFLPIVANFYIWVSIVAMDYLLYRLILSVSKHLQNLPILEVHLTLHDEENQDIIDDFPFNMPLFEPNCIPKPELVISKTWISLIIILIVLVVFGLLSSTLMQFKVLVSMAFYPNTEKERIHYLHAKLLKKRAKQPLENGKRKLSQVITKLHFWFPILQMVERDRKVIANNQNP
uniref:Dendrocyte expressed seven transmembrane protein n=2 Tax=Ornithorhynchus anatinus TaxID=9258 RepID=F7FQL5_ORNAN